MPSNNQRNNELEFTPTFGTLQSLRLTLQLIYKMYMSIPGAYFDIIITYYLMLLCLNHCIVTYCIHYLRSPLSLTSTSTTF